MRTGWTIFLWVVAIAIITFIAIYEPLTQSTRERRFQDGIVFQRDPAKVESIRVTTGDNVFEIRRKGDGWQLGPDLKDRADPKLVNHLLQTICGLTYFDRMKASEFKKEDDLAPVRPQPAEAEDRDSRRRRECHALSRQGRRGRLPPLRPSSTMRATCSSSTTKSRTRRFAIRPISAIGASPTSILPGSIASRCGATAG